MSLAQEYKQEARSSSENSKILTTASSVRINKTSSGLGNSFDLRHVCFPEFTFRETTFQTFLCLFAIRKAGQRKTLSSQRKI
jgi:hypothetical protein